MEWALPCSLPPNEIEKKNRQSLGHEVQQAVRRAACLHACAAVQKMLSNRCHLNMKA